MKRKKKRKTRNRIIPIICNNGPRRRTPKKHKVGVDDEYTDETLDYILSKISNMPTENGAEQNSKTPDRVDYSQWLQRGANTYIPTDNSKTVRTLEPGFYSIKLSQSIGYYLFKKNLKLDELARLSYPGTEEVLDGIANFWKRKAKFKEYGFAFKRGMLLYGPPGSGKTSMINLLCDDLIKNQQGIVFTITDADDLAKYKTFMPEYLRIIEPERPIITIIEDIDGLCQRTDTETEVINLLDGIEQLENVVYLATTNYAEKLSDRILNRPNRFDRRIFVGFPDEKVREEYIRFKLKPQDIEAIDLPYWVNATDEMTISHIGELIKSVIILGNDLDDSIEILKSLKKKPNSFDYNKADYDPKSKKSSVGFK